MRAKDLLPWNWHKKGREVEVERRASPRALQRQMDALFEDFFRGGWTGADWPLMGLPEGQFLPALDVENREDALSVRLEIPGMDEKDIEVNIEDDVLSIRGEKRSEMEESRKGVRWSECRYGAFERGIPLPPDLDLDRVRASFKKGILTIEMPKLESARGKGARTIEIQSS